MREGVVSLREMRRAEPGALAVASSFVRRHRSEWLVGAGGALLLGGVGAFGTDEAAPWTLYSYWLVLMLAGVAIVLLCRERLEAQVELGERPALRTALVIASASAAMTPPVWLMAALAMNGSWHPWRMIELLPQVVLVIGLKAGLLSLLSGRQASQQTRAAPSAAIGGRPALLRRLPERLAEAELLAIEAEDHYLRFHTDKGSALILMRLGDAIAALGGMEGARTHRSWWVARDAVIGASRGGGRATLRLKGGLVAPVSRTFSPELRKSGWF
jgi:hypothetical protein